MRTNSSSPRSQLLLAALLFVLSGAAALAYEIIWFKRFTHVWGSSAHSWASVVAAYLLGLGIGAALAGSRADRASRPLRLYALCELGVGVCALLVPLAISWLYGSSAALTTALSGSPLMFGVARFLLTFAVLALPTMLMGATLPLLVRHFSLQGVVLGRAAAWLYALNALGAATGAWFTGFHLIGSVGLQVANWIAAGVTFSVAAVAWFATTGSAVEAVPLAEPSAPEGESRAARPALYAAAALTGAGSLALQMMWTRDLALAVGGTIYAYTAVLAVFIVGLGLGSLGYRLWFAGRRDPVPLIAGAIAVIVLGATIGHSLSPRLGEFAGAVWQQRGDSLFNAALCMGVSFALEGPATLAMGALFPALCELAGRQSSGASRAVGAIYAWNTVGSIPAAVGTQLMLFPALDLEGTCRVALALYVAALVAVAWSSDSSFKKQALAMASASALALLVLPRPANPLIRDRGYYLYGYYYATTEEYLTQLFTRSGPTCNVLVVGENEDAQPGNPRYEQKKRTLHLNGKVDAATGSDMPTQLATAYFPHFLRPRAKNVMVIGMGSGTTSGASLVFPGVRVTCCEIEPAVFDASPLFAPYNHNPHLSPNFEPRTEDGRGFLQGTNERFDLILSEPSNPWIAGIANLFTLEFYETVRDRLAPGGMLTQWCQTYSMSTEDYALVVRTLRAVFPHVALIRVVPEDTLLLASMEPILPDRATLEETQRIIDSTPPLRSDLEYWFQTKDLRSLLLAHYVLDKSGLDRLLEADGGTTLHTDLNLTLEYDAPRRLFQPANKDSLVDAAVIKSMEVARMRELVRHLGCDESQAPTLKVWQEIFQLHDRKVAAQRTAELVLELAPDDVQMLAAQVLGASGADTPESKEQIERLARLSRDQAFHVGRSLAKSGALQRAQLVFECVTRFHPDWADGWTGLALVYADLARLDDSRQAVQRALSLDPSSELAKRLAQTLDKKN